MTPRELEKLLGGYATGTLTGDERRALFTAALEDQALFDALAREQALRDLLAEPAARAHLVAALDEPRPSRAARLAAWFRRPQIVALSAAATAAVIAIAVFVPRQAVPVLEKPVMVAENKQQPEAAPPPAAQAEAPAAPEPSRARKALPPAPREQEARREAASLPDAPAVAAESKLAEAPAVAQVRPSAPPPPPAQVPSGAVGGVIGGVPRPLIVRPGSEERLDMARAEPARMSMRQADATLAVAAKEADARGPLRYITGGPLEIRRPIRLIFESAEPGWLYVFTAEPEGWRLASGTQIAPGASATVTLRYDEPGRKEVLAVLSRSSQPTLREGESAVPPAAAGTLRIALDVGKR